MVWNHYVDGALDPYRIMSWIHFQRTDRNFNLSFFYFEHCCLKIKINYTESYLHSLILAPASSDDQHLSPKISPAREIPAQAVQLAVPSVFSQSILLRIYPTMESDPTQQSWSCSLFCFLFDFPPSLALIFSLSFLLPLILFLSYFLPSSPSLP